MTKQSICAPEDAPARVIKDQLRGHCSACGAQQAVAGGAISKHGYKVYGGWFYGVCPGAGLAPIEITREHADDFILKTEASCDELSLRANRLEQGLEFPQTLEHGSFNGRRWVSETVPFAQGTEQEKKVCVAEAVRSIRTHIGVGRSLIARLKDLIDRVHGKPLLQVKVDRTKPVQILIGEKRKALDGRVFRVTAVVKSAIFFETPEGTRGRMSSSAWRNLSAAPE